MKKFLIFLVVLIAVPILYAQPSGGNGFYRIINGSSTNQCLKFVDDRISAQKIIGSASSVNDDKGVAAIGRVQNELNDDIKLININSSFTEPGSIIYLKNESGKKNYDIISQGVGLVYISHSVFHGTIAGYIEIPGMPATITKVVDNADANLQLYTAHIRMAMYTVDQTRFLGAANNKLTLTEVNGGEPSNSDLTCRWYLRKIDENSADNYFAASPVSSFTQNGKYYTTLRTAFSYEIPSGSKVKAYKVNGALTEGKLLPLEIISGPIPPGLPVIIESTSINSSENKLKPIEPYVSAISNYEENGWLWITRTTSITGLDGITNSPYLYNNYGWHSHDYDSYGSTHQSEDVFSGWKAQGDGIGFFATKGYTGTTPIYKLGIKDGAVGFWEQVASGEIISGNEAYSPVQCQLFPVEKDLAGIVENGANDIIYDVTEVEDHYLYGAKVVGNTLYAKDFRKFKSPDVIKNGEVDGLSRFYDDVNNNVHYDQSDYDQSNWVALTGLDANAYKESFIHVKKGKLLNRINPEMRVDEVEKIQQNSNWAPNVYCPANFMGTQTGTNGQSYFFVKPKPQEVVRIVGAIYGGDNKFYVDKPGNNVNTVNIKGGFVINTSLLPSGAKFDVGTAYEFDAVVKKVESTANGLRSEPYTDGGVSGDYVVYPFSAPVVTGVQQLLEGKAQVASVKYYNMMGVESDVPFKGVNIVVTRYDDGTQSTAKVVK